MFSLCRPITSRCTGSNLQKFCCHHLGQVESHWLITSTCNKIASRSLSLHNANRLSNLGVQQQLNLEFTSRNANFRSVPKRFYSQSAEKPVLKEEAADERESNLTLETATNDEPENVDEDSYEDEEEGLHLTEEQMAELTNGDPELIKKIKYIQLEYSVMR